MGGNSEKTSYGTVNRLRRVYQVNLSLQKKFLQKILIVILVSLETEDIAVFESVEEH